MKPQSDVALWCGGLEPSPTLCPHEGPRAPDSSTISSPSASHYPPSETQDRELGSPGGRGGRTSSLVSHQSAWGPNFLPYIQLTIRFRPASLPL